MTENVQNLNTRGSMPNPGTAPTLTKGTAPKAAPTAGGIKSLVDKAASKAPPPLPLSTAEDVPTITIKLGKNSTVVELNDLMLSVPSSRLQRSFLEAHKAVHRGRLQKTRQQQVQQAKT